MDYLNHQHLYYFWVVAQEGSVTKACNRLLLAQPTVSSQIIQLEKRLGVMLFERKKNRLLLTEAGRVAMEHANEIFNSSQNLLDSLKEGQTQRHPRLRLGIDIHVSKQVALHCLQDAHRYQPGTPVTIHEGVLQDLWLELRDHELDLVLSDQTGPTAESESFFRTVVARLPVYFVAVPVLARQLKRFPRDLSKIPLIVPTPTTPFRSQIDHFLADAHVFPNIIGEIADAEFMLTLALEGLGAAPLHHVSVAADLHAGRLLRLGRHPTGIVKTIWLIARKHRRDNTVVEYLLKHFQIK